MKMSNQTIAIVFILGVLLYIGSSNMLSLGGASILSISNVQMTSNVDGLDGNAYLVTLSMGGAEEIVGEISPETISQFGLKSLPSGPFTVKFDMENYSCSYPIHNDNNTIYKMYQYTTQNDKLSDLCPWSKASLANMKARLNSGYSTDGVQNDMVVGSPPSGEPSGFQNNLAFVGRWCYWTPEDSLRYNYVNGAFRGVTANDPDGKGDWRATMVAGYPFFAGYKIGTAPKMDYKIKVTISNPQGDEVSTYITPYTKVAMLGDVARVKTVGNLLSDSFCGNPSIDYAVVKDIRSDAIHSPGTLKLVPKDEYNAYKMQKHEFVALDNDRFTQHYQTHNQWVHYDPGIGGGPVWTYLSGLNTHLRLMDDYEHTTGEFSISNESVISQPSQAPFIPMLQLIIKADWLGVKIMAGEPSIVSITPPDVLLSGGLQYVKATVKNIGDYQDEFQAYVTCDDTKNLPIRTSVPAGESSSISVPISVVKTGDANCELTVSSMNDPSAVTTKRFTAFVQQPVVVSDLIELQRLVYDRFVKKINGYDADTLNMANQISNLESRLSDVEVDSVGKNWTASYTRTKMDNIRNEAVILYAKLTELDGEVTSYQQTQQTSVTDLEKQTEIRLAELESDAQSGKISPTELAKEKEIVLFQQTKLKELLNGEIADRHTQVGELIKRIEKIKDRINNDIVSVGGTPVGNEGIKSLEVAGVHIPVPTNDAQKAGIVLIIASVVILLKDRLRRKK